jgi:predicted secreted protein
MFEGAKDLHQKIDISREGLKKVKKAIGICLLLLAVSTGFAGDIASFQNLGFSEDGRYYMFGQYGIIEDSLKHYAELYTVDVRANRFVPGGTLDAVYDDLLEPGQSGLGALFTLYQEADSFISKYRINHMKPGRLLYILVNGETPKSHLEFRDFTGGKSYVVDLLQSTFGSGENVSASFHITLSVTDKNGTRNSYTVGLPNYRREGVRGYQIRQILLAPDDSSLVFIVEKKENAESAVNIRYMVETVQIR